MFNNYREFSKIWERWGQPDRIPRLFEFGEGIQILPVIDNGTYLTSSACFLHIPGEGALDTTALPTKSNEVVSYPNGWFFIRVEVNYTEKPEDLEKRLVEAEKALQSVAAQVRNSNG